MSQKHPDIQGETAPGSRSILDFAGKAPRLRSGEDIDRQLREERASWDDE